MTIPRWKMIWTSFLILCAHAADAKTLVISDIDDTIRISHVRAFTRSAARAFFRSEAFPDMPVLFKNMTSSLVNSQGQNDAPEFFYVTSAPQLLEYNRSYTQDAFLRQHGFPFENPENLQVRYSVFDRGFDHKLTSISNILRAAIRGLSRGEELRVILIGDNGEKDPMVYAHVASTFQDPRIHFAQFIRVLYGPKLGSSLEQGNGPYPQVPFVYAAEIAAHLIEAGWMSANEAEAFFDQSTRLLEGKEFLPLHWYRCPGHRLETSMDALMSFADALSVVHRKIESTCHPKKAAQ